MNDFIPAADPAFRFVRQQYIASLQVTMQAFEHIKTGAQHYHLVADNTENVFLVALRTMPQDSTGVAHILEHTALCGSQRFPVRDPFFMMIRRSLNTFMNAFTSSDWTAYPFASQNRKDFNNLLQVYLDAVFFARLDPLDFAQEGHRLELEKTKSGQSSLVYKGVVYNEMKGAMSSVTSQLWQTLSRYLFPTTTYHYNSGGEPSHIPKLSYDQLMAFYRRHYHPSNAILMTFGNIPACEHQQHFEKYALGRFERQSIDLAVSDEQRYFSPLKVQEGYAVAADDTHSRSHVVVGWLLGSSIDLAGQLQANLLGRVLLDNSASPLRHLLETCGLGSAPSPLCGLEDSNREMAFICGIEGAETNIADLFEQQVLDCLQNVVEQGVSQAQVEAALHQLELSQREIGGDSYPYGLQLILSSLPGAIHGGDALALLNLDAVLKQLHEDIRKPNYIPELIKTLLLDNPHRVRLVLAPDRALAGYRDANEQQRLARLMNTMTTAQRQQIEAQTRALLTRQQQAGDTSSLPKLERDDIPLELTIPEPSLGDSNQHWTFYNQATNGLVYHQLVVDLTTMPQEKMPLLGLLSQLITEVGLANESYLQVQARQASVCGNLAAYISLRGGRTNENDARGFLILSIKGLISQQDAIAQLLAATLVQARFDELRRIRDLVSQLRARKQRSIVQSGHSLAIGAAGQNMSCINQVSYHMSGLAGIKWLQELDDSLTETAALEQLGNELTDLLQNLQAAPQKLVSVAESQYQQQVADSMANQFGHHNTQMPQRLGFTTTDKIIKQVWLTNSQVNFCARVFKTVVTGHADAAPLTILGEVLRNGFLHRTVREQGGAYGGGASQDSSNACFRFYSYRDPRSSETMADFSAAVDWVLGSELTQQHLEEAVLGVISSIDKPGSPAGEALQAYESGLHGRTPAHRQAFRTAILQVSLADLRRVAQQYLINHVANEAVIAPAALLDNPYFDTFEQFQI